jgi:hypothetical protein
MAKLIYIDSDFDSNREAKKISFTISEDLDIYEFKIICQRMASAMGYQQDSIQRAFGPNEKYIRKQQKVSDIISVMDYNVSGSKINL